MITKKQGETDNEKQPQTCPPVDMHLPRANQAATSPASTKSPSQPALQNLTIFREVNNHTIQRTQLNYSEKIVHTNSNIYSHNQVKKLLRFFTKLHNRI